MTNPRLLVFTDLDGTLLDHYTYDWRAAQQALDALRTHQVPVITNTSKTLAESRVMQQEVGLSGPMIVENGAGVALPMADWPHAEGEPVLDGAFRLKPFAAPYAEVRRVLEDIRRERGFDFIGFGDMTVEQVCEVTGLPREKAINAMLRSFDEPLTWRDSESALTDFLHGLSDHQLTHTRGGRFVHVMGPTDKGHAMRWLARQYGEPRPQLVALGDSINDIEMLSQADIAVLVRSPAHELPLFPPDQRPSTCLITDEYGPAGWNRALLEILEEFTCG